MRIALFSHTLRSDWNNGNAHFLRGIVSELAARGHDVNAWEPADAWSVTNLRAAGGKEAVEGYRSVYPNLSVRVYDAGTFHPGVALDGVDLAIVHEWIDPALAARIGQIRRKTPTMRLLFHDTHHRSVTDPDAMSRYDLSDYDGVLAFGESVRERYLQHGWAARVWTFHEAADTRVFHPLPHGEIDGDLVWIGNWGDDERSAELREFLIGPIRDLKLGAQIFGVRYPPEALAALRAAGITYRGWTPNYAAPLIFARHRFTVHVPRRPYAQALVGIPTIRMFEALACGIPLISAPWQDAENLFPPESYLQVVTGEEMRTSMRDLLHDPALAKNVAENGLAAILSRHTCAHRIDQLMAIYDSLAPATGEVTA